MTSEVQSCPICNAANLGTYKVHAILNLVSSPRRIARFASVLRTQRSHGVGSGAEKVETSGTKVAILVRALAKVAQLSRNATNNARFGKFACIDQDDLHPDF